jgi:flagellar motor protein MotB
MFLTVTAIVNKAVYAPVCRARRAKGTNCVYLEVSCGHRLLAKGYGEEHPVGDNATEGGRAQNRRISMLVTQK